MIISIIGTAREPEMTRKLYEKMITAALHIIMENYIEGEVILKSGGAAWSDHIAVELFLYYGFPTLTLCLPCDYTNGKYNDTGESQWYLNPGRTSNNLHSKFSSKTGKNSLKEIETCFSRGAEKIVRKGFHQRNTDVADSDLLIAFSWGEQEPTDGGTLDTWKKAKGKKIHVSLGSL